MVPKPITVILLLVGTILFSSSELNAQNVKTLTNVDEAIAIGLTSNGNVHIAKTNIELQQQGKKAAYNLNKTNIGFQYGQYNSFENDFAFELNQSIEFPTVYTSQRNLANEKIKGSQMQLSVAENNLKHNIRTSWYQLAFLKEKERLLLYQDTVYGKFLHAATIRYETGATSYLEKAAAETRVMEIQNALKIIESDIAIQENQLRVLLNDTTDFSFDPDGLNERVLMNKQDSAQINDNPMLAYVKQQIDIISAEKAVQTAKMLPDLSIGYFNLSQIGNLTSNGDIAGASNRFTGVQAGISIPLFYGSYKASINSAKLKADMAQTNAEYYSTVLKGQFEQQLREVLKYQGSLSYYRDKAIPQADLIIGNAQKSFENGAIDYVEYFQNINQGLELQFNFLNTLNGYNQAIISLEYLIGQ